jgi:hypothetical protein
MKINKESRHSGQRFLLSLRGPPESMFFKGLLDTGLRRYDGF